MCGRFSLTSPAEAVESYFDLDPIEPFPPRYNIAPSQPILIVMGYTDRRAGVSETARQVRLVRWGLVPSWAKNPADMPLMFNARSETAADKPAFRGAMRHGRILIPASGFYEWRRNGNERPQPYWISPARGGLIAFAGLYSPFMAPDGSEVETGAILTTRANETLGAIHHRMPVTIPQADFDRWLDVRNYEPRHIADLLRPADEDFWRGVPVSAEVNKVANMGPELQEAVEEVELREKSPAPQMELFGS
ncbi:SOS response-associated peptidase [Notoacmeibacter sp. MSK16QG-6]|uniref:SOS response-associated peptidase n=1 Tax=Notoacmeibacter sp. MSK16QG-6 TaxID=2957982 RepID=UPI00209DEFE1|nr:SOS response-associated peptidase [Notoacmeibacter sp. MSK16QG-6]MCP1198020.1 SOS response-associated peptidase [Notoacmeibacter sp. MSK16QG-6]